MHMICLNKSKYEVDLAVFDIHVHSTANAELIGEASDDGDI